MTQSQTQKRSPRIITELKLRDPNQNGLYQIIVSSDGIRMTGHWICIIEKLIEAYFQRGIGREKSGISILVSADAFLMTRLTAPRPG